MDREQRPRMRRAVSTLEREWLHLSQAKRVGCTRITTGLSVTELTLKIVSSAIVSARLNWSYSTNVYIHWWRSNQLWNLHSTFLSHVKISIHCAFSCNPLITIALRLAPRCLSICLVNTLAWGIIMTRWVGIQIKWALIRNRLLCEPLYICNKIKNI